MKLSTTTVGLVAYGGSGLTGLGFSAIALKSFSWGSAGLSFSDTDALGSFNGGACVNGLLYHREKELMKKANVGKEKWDQLANKFKSPNGASKGCLAVSWTKQTWKDGYWKGIIRYEWIFSKGHETMIVHGFFDSKDVHAPDTTKNNWRAIYIDTRNSEKAWKMWHIPLKDDNSDLETWLPQRPNFVSGVDPYWSFNPDYKKACEKNQDKCTGNPQNHHFESLWRWTGSGSGSHKFSDWAKNYSTAFNGYLYCLGNVVEEKGYWESI